jgi:shikimate kinase
VEADLAPPAAPPGQLQHDERRRVAGGSQEEGGVVGVSDRAQGSPGATRIVLIGFTGAGKSTVGALLAARLGWTHFDVDEAIERRVGPIPDFVAAHGVPVFRATERAVIRESMPRRDAVVSAGAGSVLPQATRRVLCHGARVFYLDVPATDLAARLAALPPERLHRPDLLQGDAAANIGAELEGRRALYQRLGARVDGTPPAAVVAEAVLRLVAG